jgi:hypothetical protein
VTRSVVDGAPSRPHDRRWHASLPRVAALVAAAAVALVPAAAPAAASAARSVAPEDDYAGRLSFEVTSIDPVVVTAGGPVSLTISGTMKNTGQETLTDLAYRFQRGPALKSTTDLRHELSTPSEPVDVVQPEFTGLSASLEPNTTQSFTATSLIAAADGLAVDAAGVYPLMINVNGDVTLEGGALPARIGELHLALAVLGVPTGAATAAALPGGGQPGTPDTGTAENSTPGSTTTRPPVPVNIIWPIADTPHLGVDGVFLNDDLAVSIAPGGRLSTLVEALTAPDAPVPPAGAITLAIDPSLLDELDRMSRGYRVLADPSQPLSPLTPSVGPTGAPTTAPTTDPTTDPTATVATTPPPGAAATATAGAPPAPGGQTTPAATTASTSQVAAEDLPGTVAGSWESTAAAFLLRLRALIAQYPTLLLPAGDPDVVALVRGGLTDQMDATVTQGRAIATRVLGPEIAGRLVADMSLPAGGALEPETLSALTNAGLGSAVLSGDAVQSTGDAGGLAKGSATAAIDATTATGNPVSAPAVLSMGGVLAGLGALADQAPTTGWAIRVNSLTALLAQQHFEANTTPSVYVPDHRWSPDRSGLRLLTDLLATLGSHQVIGPVSLTALAGSPGTPAELSYPADAQSRELSPAYLARVQQDRQDVAELRTTLGSVPQSVDPTLVLDPLDESLAASGASAFRVNPQVGEANLATVEATTAEIRNGVTISSAGNSYTLASSTSPLVLTVQNSLPYNVPVQVQITGGERVGLTVTDPGVQVIPAGRSLQVKIPAEVTRSGQFQVGAQLLGPDGTAWNDPVQLSVESSAYGAVTVVIIIAAGGVLLVMVILRIAQRLRNRRDRLSGNGDGGTPLTADPSTPVNGSRARTDDESDQLLPDESLRVGGPPAADPPLRSVIPGSATAPSSAPSSAATKAGTKAANAGSSSVANSARSDPSTQPGPGVAPDAGHLGSDRP